MKKIIIDTNALMAMAEFKIDVFSELERSCDFLYKIFVLQGTIQELEKIQKEQPGKFRQAAKLALAILRVKKVAVIDETGVVDDLLVEHSQHGDLILTQDILLKKRLQRPYLTIRQKKKIVLVL